MSKKSTTPVMPQRGSLLQVPIANIRTTGTNPRKAFHDEDIEELSKSIASIGLMQPIVCMKADDDFIFTLICGERRYRAAMKAGLDHIPGMVYDILPPDTVFEMQITENLQRKDINPMEESMAFSELVKRGIKTAEQIADKLGVSKKYIYDRLALQNVIPEVQDKIRKGELSISHGKQFARISKVDQEKLWASVSSAHEISLSRVKELLTSTFTHKLGEAVFSLSDPLLHKPAGSCEACPKRSGCNQLLFDDITAEDICFDADCYNTKTENHLEEMFESMVKEGKKVVKISCHWSPTRKDVVKRFLWSEVDKNKPFDAYGLIVEAHPYDKSQPLGKVIKVELENEEDDDDDLSDEGSGSTGISSLTRSSHTHNQVVRNGIDYEEVFVKKVRQKLSDQFFADPSVKSRSQLLERFVSAFFSIDDEYAEELLTVLGWEKAPAEHKHQTYNQRKTAFLAAEKFNYSNEDLINFTLFFDRISDVSEYMLGDWDDYKETHDTLSPLGIDLKSIIDEVNQEAGDKVLELPEPEEEKTPDAEEEESPEEN